MTALLMLVTAFLIDFLAGEPPRAIHPVVGMGKMISSLVQRSEGYSQRIRFALGVGITTLTVTCFALPAYYLLSYLYGVNTVAYVVVGALLLSSTFSLRELSKAALKVKALLETGKIDGARSALRALVSRDTSNLTGRHLVSAAVESTAESACDSFVAPLFFFLILGVPGALAYRCVSTLDSMIGYHGEYEYLGKFPSHLDDVLNYIPARITALLISLSALLSGRNGRLSWQIALRDHRRTESPNAGWPMAAAAGALNIQLEKIGYYRLGNNGRPLFPAVIGKAVGLLMVASAIWMLVCYGIEVVYLVY